MKATSKKIFTFAIFALFSYYSYAQAGIGGGYATSNITEMVDGYTYSYELTGFYLELNSRIEINDKLSATPTIKYVNATGLLPGSGNRGQWREQYLDIPLKLNYERTNSNGFGLSLFVAPTFSYCLVSQFKYEGIVGDFADRIEYDYGVSGAYKPEDWAVTFGLTILLGDRVSVGVDYLMGLTDRSDADWSVIKRNGLNAGLSFVW